MTSRMIEHSCGHMERVDVDGPYVVVNRRVEHVENTPCEACQGRRMTHVICRSDRIPFCELWGERNECLRAEKYRRLAYRRALVITEHATGLYRDGWEEIQRMILRQNDAHWWCEHRLDALDMLQAEIRLTD